MKNIAITGATGLVGTRIFELLGSEMNCIPLSSHDFDLTNQADLRSTMNDLNYDILLHLAAYTNVDKAEVERDKAHAINVEGTRYLFEQTQRQNKLMIYVSTDFVFDGKNPPYDEDSTPHPVGYYGQTKYEGEQIVKGKAMIVRISYPYSIVTTHPSEATGKGRKPDFVQRIRSLLKENKELTMITDASMTPTCIDDIAYGLKYLIDHYTPGVYHLVGSQSYSPFEVGQMIAQHYELPEWLIQPTTFAEYMKGKAMRPQYSETVSRKNTFHPMRAFSEGLKYLPL